MVEDGDEEGIEEVDGEDDEFKHGPYVGPDEDIPEGDHDPGKV
jgi:hypothetical protein